MMNDPRIHWDQVYGTKSDSEVSWYQPRPVTSLELIRGAAPDPSTSVIDVGSGTSTLVDELLAAGFQDVSALDTSSTAIERVRTRLGAAADRVEWIVASVTDWRPRRKWGVWHDRAVFHFLTEPALQDAYIQALSEASSPGSVAIISTFALDGPERCSGLPVERYSAETLSQRMGAKFSLVAQTAERHVTPRGAIQNFIYAVFERR